MRASVVDVVGRRLLIAWAICVLGPLEAAAAAQKEVLVLYSTRRDAQVAILGDRDLPRILEEGLGQGVDFYSEYIDLARSTDSDYENAFREFLSVKYEGRRFDLVIAIQNVAVDFMSKQRDTLFGETPLVFVATPMTSSRIPNSTGLVLPVDLTGTIDLAVQLQPDLRQVFVVSGADPRDVVYERLARQQFEPLGWRIAFTYLTGLTTKDLESRLARLPPGSAVYYLLVNRDREGESFHPLDYLDQMASVSSAPIYSWVDSTMGRGVVGGSLKDLARQTRAVGEMAVRVLKGEPPDSIPIATPDLNAPQVDWRQLRRWGLSEARLPAGTIVRFKEPTTWDQYKVYIVGAAAILVAQTALIAGLLVQNTRRRRAEARLRESERELRASHERIHDLGGRLLNAQEAERSWVARELHDDISQQVALLTIDLESLGAGQRARTDEHIAVALNRAHTIARNLHDLSHRLHPAKLRLIGLVAALRILRHESSSPGMSIDFTHADVPASIREDLTLCLYRVVQEALRNAVKHSKANYVSVHLKGGAESLTLTIADDGVGFDVEDAWGRGLGLVSMAERVEAIGGRLVVRSNGSEGTRLEVSVPMVGTGERADSAQAEAAEAEST